MSHEKGVLAKDDSERLRANTKRKMIEREGDGKEKGKEERQRERRKMREMDGERKEDRQK